MRYAFIVGFFGVMILAAVVLVGIAALVLIHQRSIVANTCASSPTRQMDFERCGDAPLPGNALPLRTSEMSEPPEITTRSYDVLMGYGNRAPITTDGRNNTLIGSIHTPAENGGTLCTTSEGHLGAHRAGTMLCSPLQGAPK